MKIPRLEAQREVGVGGLQMHFQETLRTLALLLGQFAKKMTHALQSHIVAVEIEAQREVGVGGLQMHVDQAVDEGLHLGGIILTNLGAHGWSAIRS